MGIKLLALFAFASNAFAADLPVNDADFKCISATQAERYVTEFGINVNSFGGMELCNSTVDTKKLFNDLQLVEEGRFSGAKKNLFIRDAIPVTQYYSWLKRMTAGIRRGHDMPTATAYNSGGYFTMQDGWATLSTLGRVGTLVHEARHTEGHRHMQCSHGPYKDAFMSGCDSSIAQGGSHGIEMEYYSRVVLQGENFHPAYAQMARLMNLARANFVFNQDPMTQAEALVAVSNQDLILLNQQGVLSDQSIQGLSDYRLHRASHGVSLQKDNVALAVDLNQKNSTPVEDDYSYFKLLSERRLNEEYVELQEVDLANRRYLLALTKSGKLYTYEFAQGGWSNPSPAPDVAALITTAPNGLEGIFVLTKTGQVQPIDPRTLTRSPALATNWPDNAEDFVNWNSQLLMVSSQGKVEEVSSGKSFSPLSNRSIQQLVRAPVYNAFTRSEEL